MLLGVNIDHIATLREARKSFEPDIMTGAILAQLGGADGITVHLRRDRRHINEDDIIALKAGLSVPLNVEISSDKSILEFICSIQPEKVCLVPESPSEITTEGGLNLLSSPVFKTVNASVIMLHKAGIEVSLFIEPDMKMIDSAAKIGAECIELNTKAYSESETVIDIEKEYDKLSDALNYAVCKRGLIVNMGHGLNYDNVSAITTLENVTELNIGHSIIAKSVFTGIEKAVKLMRDLIDKE